MTTQKEFHETYFAKEFSRLKALEEQYKCLLYLISIFSEKNLKYDTVTIKITKNHMLKGKNWKEILNLALDDA